MIGKTPKLREWHGLKPPKIRTVKSLRGKISTERYSQVCWIAKIRPIDNVIIETYPMKSWHFVADGRLIGEINTGSWQRMVEINLDE